jgi:hypothetical protein
MAASRRRGRLSALLIISTPSRSTGIGRLRLAGIIILTTGLAGEQHA